MANFASCKQFLETAEKALFRGMDYLMDNRIYSVWSGKDTGWQEMWMKSKFSGLYATTNALSLICKYYERYESQINEILEELDYLFDFDRYTSENPKETIGEERYKRCKFLYDQNINTTLKAIYFYRANLCLCKNGIEVCKNENHAAVMEKAVNQIKNSYNPDNGQYRPSVGNDSDISMMTTSQAHVIATEIEDTDKERLDKTQELFMSCIEKYQGAGALYEDKFKRYEVKRDLIASVYALSHTYARLDLCEREKLLSVVLEMLNDYEFRDGFMIKDSYMVSGTVESRDAYVTDSRILLLDSVLTLINIGELSPYTVDMILDDMNEIIECVLENGRYLAWDMNPSFSHNVKALKILEQFIECLKRIEIDMPIINVHPAVSGKNSFRSTFQNNCVVFMSFKKEHSDSFFVSVQDILSGLGIKVWCALNDPFGVNVIENIWGSLNSAAFVIADCTTRSANVMYEVGLSHGLHKPILLCAPNRECLPYEGEYGYDFCKYNPNGEENPPPYADLQLGILEFVEKHVKEICLSNSAAEEMLGKIAEIKQYCTEV